MTIVSTPHSPHQSSLASGQAQRKAVTTDEATEGPDTQLVAEMKHEINSLVQEVTRLAAEDISPDDFYSGFMTRVASAMGAVGGAVWTRGDNGRLALQFQINLAPTGVEATPQARNRHGLLIKSVVDSSQAMLVAPSSGASSDAGLGNP